MEGINPNHKKVVRKIPELGDKLRIQVVSKYLAFAQEGLVPEINCPMDQGLLMCNIDYDDKIFLYCLSCDYKKYLGTDFYKDIILKLEEIQNGRK